MINLDNFTMNLKKYWINASKLQMHFFLCSLLTIVISLTNHRYDIESFIGSFIGIFLLLFFWSWNKNDIKSKWARLFIHTICWAWCLISFCCFIFISYKLTNFLSSGIGWYILLYFTFLTFFTYKKYKNLMYE